MAFEKDRKCVQEGNGKGDGLSETWGQIEEVEHVHVGGGGCLS